MRWPLCLAALLILGADVATAADCAARRRVAIVPRPLTVVPFAVPVAVPVAHVVTPTVLYSASSHLPPPAPATASIPTTTSAAAPDSAATQQPAASLIARRCTGCHGGQAPKAGLDLTDLSQLDAPVRLDAVRRVVSDDPAVRMPRGAPLSPAEIGAILQELSAPQ